MVIDHWLMGLFIFVNMLHALQCQQIFFANIDLIYGCTQHHIHWYAYLISPIEQTNVNELWILTKINNVNVIILLTRHSIHILLKFWCTNNS